MILWRQLFDAIGVRWIDRGHNTARGHVNIPCPWCGTADPSFHLGIEEATGAYYCLRSQPPHAGRSTPFLLMKLGVPSFQIDALLRDYSDDSPPPRTLRLRETTGWESLASAADYPAALTYLSGRGLAPPAVLARRYDMRFATVGRHAWRVLLPLHLNFTVVGWTGRAIGPRQSPRYLTNDPSDGASLYIPAYPTKATHTIVIVEGPFDALAIADAYHPVQDITAIALTGLNIGRLRREHLGDVIGLAHKPNVLVTLDEDQSTYTSENLKDVLAHATGLPQAGNFPLPSGVKDAGEMTRSQIRTWLTERPQQQHRGGDILWGLSRNGPASSKTGRGPI
jgi:hypothetical protein